MKAREIRRIMSLSTFCYAKKGGQGFKLKSECKCTCELLDKVNCQAYKDKCYFEMKYNEMALKNMSRDEILSVLKEDMKDSQWFKDNVRGYEK